MSSTILGDTAPDDEAVGKVGRDRCRASGTSRVGTVSAGFGSPSADSTVKRIDLNDAFIRHPDATYVMRAAGDAMRDAGIDSGDVLLVDRALTPVHGRIVIAVVDGELTCRRLWREEIQGHVRVRLQPANPEHQDIAIGDEEQLEVWGVVTTVVKSLLV